VAYWKLDEASGATSFNDASANGNIGSCGPACPTMGVPGAIGTAAEFNGVNSQIVIPDSPSLRLNQFTIALWIYPLQVRSDYQPLVVKEDSSAYNRNYGLYIVLNTMQIRYSAFAGDCVTRFAANSASQLTLNAWNHVAFTYDGVTEKLYLNGVLDISNAAVSASLCQAAVPVKLGMETSALIPFDGSLDEIQIFNQALSAAGAMSLYRSP
jgi:Concanavalin A-like lectin/glucanases superfamily